MSIRIWKEIADQKKQVEDQRKTILNAFKKRSVEDQMGTIQAEKLFQPITKLMAKRSKEDKPFPDYDIDDQTRLYKNELPFADYPFDEGRKLEQEELPYADLKPFTEEEIMVPATESQAGSEQDYEWDEDIIPLPEKPIPGPEEVKPFPVPEEDPYADLEPFPVPEELGLEVPPGEKASSSVPSYSEATRDDKPPKYKEPRANDSRDLTILKKFIANNEGNPDAIIKTSKSPFLGYDVAQAKYRVHEIYTERAKQVLEKGDRKSVIGQKGLGPYEGKSNSEMREMIAEFEKGKSKAKTGSGFNTLINRLSLGISSIFSGNTSVKLKKEIRAIAKLLHKQGIISNEQKNKVLHIK